MAQRLVTIGAMDHARHIEKGYDDGAVVVGLEGHGIGHHQIQYISTRLGVVEAALLHDARHHALGELLAATMQQRDRAPAPAHHADVATLVLDQLEGAAALRHPTLELQARRRLAR